MATLLIRHLTVYRYRNPVAFGEHRFMLRPREGFDQRTTAFELLITPEPVDLVWQEDASGNLLGTARFGRRARELRFEARMEVEQTVTRPDDLRLAAHARTCPFSYGQEEGPDLARFVERQAADPGHAVDGWARAIRSGEAGGDSLAVLAALNGAIRRDFAYIRREEAGIQPPAETLARRQGSCRDFALLMMEAARALGFAARFVSGYLKVEGAGDRSAQAGGFTHAWLQVYVPGAGWVDHDPTSGRIGNAGLVRVAAVRDPRQAVPLAGSFIGFPSDHLGMSVEVGVKSVDPDERNRGPGVAA